MWGSMLSRRKRIASAIRRHELLFRARRARPKGFPVALWKPSASHLLTGIVLKRWQVAAALSAAVTTIPKTRNRAQLTWAHKSKGTHKPIPSYSSGEGIWGRGASLREAASPPASPSILLFERGSGGERFSLEKCSPPESPLTKLSSLRFFCAFCAFFRLG